MKNWKTTLAGIVTAAGAVAGALTGHISWIEASTIIVGGLGLIGAKDHNRK
jgi:hypothetical protein